MTPEQKRRNEKLIDRLFGLAGVGRCSCWPQCAYKEAHKVLAKFLRDMKGARSR